MSGPRLGAGPKLTSGCDRKVLGAVLAVIDEVAPFVGGGVHYSVVAGELICDKTEASRIVREVVRPGRRNPFHHATEGPTAKAEMIEALSEIGVVARAVVVPCGRRRQEAARRVGLEVLFDHFLADGVDEVIIESRTPPQDGRERLAILDILRERKAASALTYGWDRKTNELLWIAEAIGGAVRCHLTGIDTEWYHQVARVTGLSPEWAKLPSA